MITVTESAKTQALRLMKEDNLDNHFIRVGVKGGGCSGLSYDLKFDNTILEGDQEFEDKGIKIPESFLLDFRNRIDKMKQKRYI